MGDRTLMVLALVLVIGIHAHAENTKEKRTVGAGHLFLYEHEDYKGKRLDFTSSSKQITASMNDKASSIKITGNSRWRVFQDANFKGRSRLLKPGKYPNWKSFFAANDVVSSIKKLGPAKIQDHLFLYEHDQYKGKVVDFTRSSKRIPASMNDKASSVVITGKSRWKVYEHINFKGRWRLLKPGRYPKPKSWFPANDVISSIRKLGSVIKNQKRTSCQDVAVSDVSKEYTLLSSTGRSFKVYCYFSKHGIGYTFLSKEAVYNARSLGLDLTNLYTETDHALLRWKLKKGAQTQAVIRQMNPYSKIPLGFKLNTYKPYNRPQNDNKLGGGGYLLLGLLDTNRARHKTVQGIKADGKVFKFRNCDANPNSYFAFYTRQKQGSPINRNVDSGPGTNARKAAKPVARPFYLPDNYFFYEENHFGGCGGYSQTGGWRDAIGSALGLPFFKCGRCGCKSTYTQCGASGDPHFYTFDRIAIHFMGLCTYSIAKPCDAKAKGLQDFNVMYAGQRYGKTAAVIKYMLVKVGGILIKLDRNNVVYIDNERVHLPYTQGKVSVFYSGGYVRVCTTFGLRVGYNGKYTMWVQVPKEYKGKMCGICGNNNGIPADDWRTSRGVATKSYSKIGNSWFEPGMDPTCKTNPNPPWPKCSKANNVKVRGKGWCGRLKTGPFKRCNKKINPKTYLTSCYYDLCLLGLKKDALCKSLEGYANDCRQKGVVLKWRKASGCQLKCGRNKVYSHCAPACADSCGDLSASKRPGCRKQQCSEGCVCKKGFVLSGRDCVRRSKCGCTDGGRYFKGGEKWIDSKCQWKKTCKGGVTKKKKVPTATLR